MRISKIGKKLVIGILALGILGVFLLLSINQYIKQSVKKDILTMNQAEDLKDVDCILVLGAGVREDGTPSLMLNERLELGIALYQSGASQKLLMSGDHGRKDYDEVNTMKGYALSQGITSEDVFMDHAGFSTYESIYRAKEIFQAKKIIIVSQEYHLYRALYIADKFGIEAYGVAAKGEEYQGQAYREFREILARNKDFFSVIFRPKPTYLGEAIPVSGDGDVTNDE